MKHTGAEIEDAARRFEQLAENLDPASVAAEDLSDMRRLSVSDRGVSPAVSARGRPGRRAAAGVP